LSAVPAARDAGIALAGAYVGDLVFGDPRRLHPVAGFGWLAARTETLLYGPSRARGLAFTGLLVGSAALTAELAARLAARLAAHVAARDSGHHASLAGHHAGPSGRPVVLGLVTWIALGGTSLRRVGDRLADQLDAGELDAARGTLPSLCGRDPQELDAGGLCRAAVESVAENTGDAVVGALLWGAVAGPGGVAAYRAANTLDAMVGHRTDRYADFGWASARLDDLLNWPAARLTAILAAVCAPLVGGSSAAARASTRRDGSKHPSPNAGRVEAAFAGALGVRLGGRVTYGGVLEHRPLLGEGAPPTTADLRRTTRLSLAVGVAAAVLAGAVSGLAPVRKTPASPTHAGRAAG
jgi:adenosylcobinamide-phosphate synthase